MIVEDGTGLSDANSYVSVEFADDYFSARGVSEWSAFENKEQILVKATDFIDSIFQWYGKKEFEGQALRFPRTELYDYEGLAVKGVPNCLKQAVCDAALLALNGNDLFLTKDANGNVVSERIGELAFTYSKTENETVASSTLYDSINTKLRGLYRENKAKIISGKVQRV